MIILKKCTKILNYIKNFDIVVIELNSHKYNVYYEGKLYFMWSDLNYDNWYLPFDFSVFVDYMPFCYNEVKNITDIAGLPKLEHRYCCFDPSKIIMKFYNLL